MRIETLRSNELAEDLARQWRRIQRSDESLASPFLCPEFSRAAGDFFPDTYVGVIEEAGRVIGFLPFERYWGGGGRGVMNGRADYQGLIVDPAADWAPEQLLRGCDLRFLEFDHLLASQTPFQAHHQRICQSHVIDLSGAPAAYREEHAKQARERARQARQAEREVGPIRVELECDSVATLRALIEMKRQQYARTGLGGGLAGATDREFLERLHATPTEDFGGALSALYIGDRLAAAHFGLRSRHVLHWWFPVYDRALRKYSPGWLLLQHATDAAERLGVTKIDLGYGDEPYKLRVANRHVPLASVIVGDSWSSSLRRYRQRVKQHVGGTRFEAAARMVYRGIAQCVSRAPADATSNKRAEVPAGGTRPTERTRP